MGMAELRKAAPIVSLSMDCGLSGMVVVWCIVRCASIHAGLPYGTCMANEVQPRRLFAAQKPRNPTGKGPKREKTDLLSFFTK